MGSKEKNPDERNEAIVIRCISLLASAVVSLGKGSTSNVVINRAAAFEDHIRKVLK